MPRIKIDQGHKHMYERICTLKATTEAAIIVPCLTDNVLIGNTKHFLPSCSCKLVSELESQPSVQVGSVTHPVPGTYRCITPQQAQKLRPPTHAT